MIFDISLTSVGGVSSGTVLVQDIWSRLTSVEDVDARPRSWEGGKLVAM